MTTGHILLTPKTCPCDKTSDDQRCPTCDWGLSVCAVCGAAEIELDGPCGPPIVVRIRGRLIEHLGSANAADVWLTSTNTGYPTTALDAIRAGHGEAVLDDLENRWGPGPHYA